MGAMIRSGCNRLAHTRHRQSGAPAYGSDAVIGGKGAFVVLEGTAPVACRWHKTQLPAETTASPPAPAHRLLGVREARVARGRLSRGGMGEEVGARAVEAESEGVEVWAEAEGDGLRAGMESISVTQNGRMVA